MMFERFTKSARAAIVLAQEEAREMRSPRIDVEHVLLGLVVTGEGRFAELLTDVGLTADAVRESIAAASGAQPLGPEDADALRSIGIDLDAVRASLDSAFGADALDRATPQPRRKWFGGHIPFTSGAKKVLELSLREALAHKDDHMSSEHVLLGVLRAPSDTARSIIENRIALAELRRRVVDLLDRAA